MNFTDLFTYFQNKEKGGALLFQKGCLGYVGPTVSTDHEALLKTKNLVKVALQSFDLFQSTPKRLQEKILGEISSSCRMDAPLLNRIYRSVVEQFVSGYEEIGLKHKKGVIYLKDEKLIVSKAAPLFSSKQSLTMQNSALRGYVVRLKQRYGETKVERVFQSLSFNYDERMKQCTPLTPKDIRVISLALNDVHIEELKECLCLIRGFIGGSLPFSAFPKKVQEGLLFHAEKKTVESVLALCKKHVSDLNFMVVLLRPDLVERECSLMGKRVHGVMAGHRDFGSKYKFSYHKRREDKERWQVYEEIYNLRHLSEESFLLRYLEIWAKCLIKKEISSFPSLNKGVIVPYLEDKWLYVSSEIRDLGKVSVHLKPLGDGPSIVVHRSTASSPSATHSLYTILQDFHPFAPPGYLNPEGGFSEELAHFLDGENPLIITGHSLGGSFAQVQLIKILRHLEEKNIPFPKRYVSLYLFDSPGITSEDALFFARYLREHQDIAKRLQIHYFFSEGDILTSAGDVHLGYGLNDEECALLVTLVSLTKPSKHPNLQFNPHARFYFRDSASLEDLSFKEGGAAFLKHYDNLEFRRRYEARRAILGFFIYPFLFALAFFKRHIIGLRGERGLLQRFLNLP